MEAKITRTLKKLVSIMPSELKDGWRFHVYNVGGANFGGAWYGIISENDVIPGINIACQQSFRQSIKTEKVVPDPKLANVLAAYIAFAQPATVLALIEENEGLRGDVEAYHDTLVDNEQYCASLNRRLVNLRTENKALRNRVKALEADAAALADIARVFAAENPKWSMLGYAEQDPHGVHATLEKHNRLMNA